jgi:nucleoside-diphosphate-sugar epimerase
MTRRPRVLVTGATGFIGTALVTRLTAERWPGLRSSARRITDRTPEAVDQIQIDDVNGRTDWTDALVDVDCVVHLAARVHEVSDTAADPLDEFRRVNVEGTLNLAQQATAAGVRRLVYLSTIKVNGEQGTFTADDPPNPHEPYAISKHEAEVALRELSRSTGLEVVIIRPPLVYGPGVKANFRSLMRTVRRGIPLPLGAISNRRSLIGVDNLVDFIVECIEQPRAANTTFLVSDGEDVSTTDLVRGLAKAMGRPVRLIPVPAGVLMVAATLIGKRGAARRLLGSLVVDSSRSRRDLGWTPPHSVEEGLRRAVKDLA